MQGAFVSRTFAIEKDGEPTKELLLELATPRAVGEAQWECRYRFSGPWADREFKIIGLDSLQALQLALVAAHGRISGWAKQFGAGVTWQGDADLCLPAFD
jgi:hypothetical protein